MHPIADVTNIDTSGITALEEIHKKLTSVNIQVNYLIKLNDVFNCGCDEY